MKREILLLFTGLLVLAGCQKEEVSGREKVSEDIPDCIENKIQEMAQAPVANPPAKVYLYRYKGKTIYYIPAKCCDFPSLLVDAACNTICSPDGGLSGKGDGTCPDFISTRTDERLIWEDPRSK
jgi:hypothetical protein